MKNKWIPVTGNYELNDTAIVTRKINNSMDVTIGLPGWGVHNSTIAYMSLPTVDDPAWISEYREGEPPKASKGYIVLLLSVKNYSQPYKIVDGYFLKEKGKWLRIPENYEFLAWMEYPKPYQN